MLLGSSSSNTLLCALTQPCTDLPFSTPRSAVLLVGLIVSGWTDVATGNEWPTDEMASRGNLYNLVAGVLYAVPSGAGVAFSTTAVRAATAIMITYLPVVDGMQAPGTCRECQPSKTSIGILLVQPESCYITSVVKSQGAGTSWGCGFAIRNHNMSAVPRCVADGGPNSTPTPSCDSTVPHHTLLSPSSFLARAVQQPSLAWPSPHRCCRLW